MRKSVENEDQHSQFNSPAQGRDPSEPFRVRQLDGVVESDKCSTSLPTHLFDLLYRERSNLLELAMAVRPGTKRRTDQSSQATFQVQRMS